MEEHIYKQFVQEFNKVYAYPTGLTASYDEEYGIGVQITGSQFLSNIEDIDGLLFSPVLKGVEVYKVNGFKNLFELLNHFNLQITPVVKWNEIKYLQVGLKEGDIPTTPPTHTVLMNPDGKMIGYPVPLRQTPELTDYSYDEPRNRYVRLEESGNVRILFDFR